MIINTHVLDRHNIGDLCSSPVPYFPWPTAPQVRDIREVESWLSPALGSGDPGEILPIVVGGGGLLYQRFLPAFQTLHRHAPPAHLVAWGIGQQHYATAPEPLETPEAVAAYQQHLYQRFDYGAYLDPFGSVGIRDWNHPRYEWVPCASCLDPAFDRPRSIQHPFVVFSHRKFQLHIPGLPRLTHDYETLEPILDFLGSGETILTSSYHGAYWGTLLGRKVLAFPFSSKFYTLHPSPRFYPVGTWQPQPLGAWGRLGQKIHRRLQGKVPPPWIQGFKPRSTHFECPTADWQTWAKAAIAHPEALEICRQRNRDYGQQVLGRLV